MAMAERRFMRTLLFFDLPSVTKKDHREYRKFLKMLSSHGFAMLQESVYTKLSINESSAESTIREVKKELPPDGIVSCITITEKQFAEMEILLGEMETDVLLTTEKVVHL